MFRSTLRFVTGCVVSSPVVSAAIVGAGLLFAISAQPAWAIVIQSNSQGGTQTFFAADDQDLINAGQPSYDAVNSTVSGFTSGGGSSINGLNDGNLGTPSITGPSNTWGADAGDYTRTFVFDTTSFPLGYKITEINSIASWTNSRYRQEYTLEYSTVDAPTIFNSLTSVDYNPTSLGSNNATLVNLTDSTGVLALGVKALRFNFLDGGTTVYQEIDVYGVGIQPVPEPTTLVLIGLPALLLLKRLRRRSTVAV